ATPYLLIGLFPKAISWLPKPGMWMVRLKEIAGLVLMATVLFIIWALDETQVFPCIVMLTGLSVSFWIIGSMDDLNTPAVNRWMWRGVATAIAVLTCWFSGTTVNGWAARRQERLLDRKIDAFLTENKLTDKLPKRKPASDEELPWETFSSSRLK